jgi:hypothetical protein
MVKRYTTVTYIALSPASPCQVRVSEQLAVASKVYTHIHSTHPFHAYTHVHTHKCVICQCRYSMDLSEVARVSLSKPPPGPWGEDAGFSLCLERCACMMFDV